MSDGSELLKREDAARNLEDFEIEVLEMLDGRRELPWGAAVSVALEHLSGCGFAANGLPYRITSLGKAVLETKSLVAKGSLHGQD